MGNTRWGKLQLQAGVRWERTETASKGFDPLTATEVQKAGYAISTTTRRATTIAGMNYQLFSNPRVTRTGSYDDSFRALPSSTRSVPTCRRRWATRTPFRVRRLMRSRAFGASTRWAKVVTAPNPELLPERSNNYVARLAWYFEPVGSLTVLGQQTEISNQRVNTRISAADFGYASDPEYADYEFQSFANRSDVYRYRSLEVGYNQQLAFLPGSSAARVWGSATPVITPISIPLASRRTSSLAASPGPTAA
jgi:outer membrane receptor protein involved in Fe transport